MTEPTSSSAYQAGGDETPVATTSAQGPAELWLQLHGDCDEAELSQPVDYTRGDVTWCWHEINDSDVRYVRADLARPTPAAAAGVPTDNRGVIQAVRQSLAALDKWRMRAPCHGTPCEYTDLIYEASSYLQAVLKRTASSDPTRDMNCLEARAIDRAYAICDQCNTGFPERCRYMRRAVLSAGAPAVPLKDEQDSSSSVHQAADDSSRALRAASQDAPLAWQPIETAPKDGR